MNAREIIVSHGQSIVSIGGTSTTFLETKQKKKGNCDKCWWRDLATAEECNKIPCNPDERTDGKYGVFTIQNMPEY